MRSVIFSRELTANGPLEVKIRLEIEAPEFVSAGEFSCVATFHGESTTERLLRGVDAWQAVELAMRFLDNEVKILQDRGYSLAWPADGSPFVSY